MRSTDAVRTIAGLLAVGLTAGCATHQAPRGFTPRLQDLSNFPRGAWAVATLSALDRSGEKVAGELLTLDAREARLLTSSGVVRLPLERVARLHVETHRTREVGLALWTTAGALSTASHGGFLVLTFPMWLISGIAATAVESRAGILEHPPRPLPDLQPFARFPQGWPEGLDEAQLGALQPPGPEAGG